ncbi:HAD family phosphatase [Ktedonosporobacter rubrisoli]|uniref:HAD family phosphatase n=1 Tax=Ktedonosporobacter rubrisoli TaxID=2509675 RepID=A0A4P6K380_KTERU|nr:Cof-type HAD-IIB family hydrolase [Ktedonosporobacter rubrisoli]QBD82402.1 HAD family phosphatase [Ktedonosporobacter rubrisoli]
MYRLLAIDLDGTLLTPEHKITPRNFAAVSKAVEAGMTIVVATGQTLNVLRAVCAELPLNAPQIVYNGAMIADIHSGVVLHEHLVPEELILPTLAVMREAGLYRVYHTHQHVFVDQNTPNARNWYRPPAPPALEVTDVASLYPRPCIKLVGVGAAETLRQKRIELEQRLAGQLYVTQASSELLEFMHPVVSKGYALGIIANILGIAPEEIVAIGDNHNDIGMLRFAGLGIAMGNASNEVKAEADYVTLPNAEDGVAAAIEEKVLPLLEK